MIVGSILFLSIILLQIIHPLELRSFNNLQINTNIILQVYFS